MTRTDQNLAPNRANFKHATEGGKEMSTFNYDQVVSLKLKYAGGSTREFYCIDLASVHVIRLLAEQCSFADWEKPYPDLWVRKEPKERLIVSRTPSGWLAFRSYKSPTGFRSIEPFTKTLTHLEYVVPILFPDPEITLAAAELCYPQPHSALRWISAPECMTDPDSYEYCGALGNIGWERSLPEDACSGLARQCRDEQAASRPKLDSDATLGDVPGTALKNANLHIAPTVTEH
jgi:hypothetical protein